MTLPGWQLTGVEGRYARLRWWQRNGPRILDPTNSPVDLNLANKEDPWPGDVVQFRSMLYRQADLAGVTCRTRILKNRFVIRLKIEAPKRPFRPLLHPSGNKMIGSDGRRQTEQQAWTEAQEIPLIQTNVPEPKTPADFPCDCGTTNRRQHADRCNVWRLFDQFVVGHPLDEDPES